MMDEEKREFSLPIFIKAGDKVPLCKGWPKLAACMVNV